MKENETYEKLPYLSPAIDVVSLHNRLATICASLTGDIGDGGARVGDIKHEEDNW